MRERDEPRRTGLPVRAAAALHGWITRTHGRVKAEIAGPTGVGTAETPWLPGAVRIARAPAFRTVGRSGRSPYQQPRTHRLNREKLDRLVPLASAHSLRDLDAEVIESNGALRST